MPTIYLGTIPLGQNHMTGPTEDDEYLAATLPEHAVARGKPVIQDVGDELDQREFRFFFDESFCNVAAEYGKLRAALISRSALPLVTPSLGYAGARYMVQELVVRSMATTSSGRMTRIEATVSLIEAPRSAGFGGLIGQAIGLATNAALNVVGRR